MSWQQTQITLKPRARGFHLIDDEILAQLSELANYKNFKAKSNDKNEEKQQQEEVKSLPTDNTS